MKGSQRKTRFLASEPLKSLIEVLFDSLLGREEEEPKEEVITLASFMPSSLRKEALMKQVREGLSPMPFATALMPLFERRPSRRFAYLLEDIETTVEILNRIYGESSYRDLYRAFLGRRRKMVEELSGRRFNMRVASPIILGLTAPLGSLLPCLDPLYGFPRITAQSIRGALREHLLSNGMEGEAALLCGLPSRRGTLMLFDGVPSDVEHLRIDYDAACCHAPLYYRSGMPPDDWHEPELHRFFVLPERGVYEFAFVCNDEDRSPDEITELLSAALSEVGVGARRHLSYGLLLPVE